MYITIVRSTHTYSRLIVRNSRCRYRSPIVLLTTYFYDCPLISVLLRIMTCAVARNIMANKNLPLLFSLKFLMWCFLDLPSVWALALSMSLPLKYLYLGLHQHTSPSVTSIATNSFFGPSLWFLPYFLYCFLLFIWELLPQRVLRSTLYSCCSFTTHTSPINLGSFA